MPSTVQFEIDSLSDQAKDTYYYELDHLHNSYGPPSQDHRCHGAQDHHDRYNWEDAYRFQAYTKALNLRFEEPPPGKRGTVTAPEVDTVQGHYGIYRIVDSVPNARIAQACHPGLHGMEFVEISVSDQLYFGDLLAIKALAFNPGYNPRLTGSTVLPYLSGKETLPGDHCRYSARDYLIFRRDIRRAQQFMRVDHRVGVIDGYSGLVRLPPSISDGCVFLGDVFYPVHLDIRGFKTTILTALPTIIRYWTSRNPVSESLKSLADSADLQTTRFDHQVIQRQGSIARDHLTITCTVDWREGSRVLVGLQDRDIEAEIVKNNGCRVMFRFLERCSGALMAPVTVQQLGFQGVPWERPREQRRSRSASGERYPDPDRPRNREQDSPSFEERYGRSENRSPIRGSRNGSPRGSRGGCRSRSRSPEGNWDSRDGPAGQWDSQPGSNSRDFQPRYRARSPEDQWDSRPRPRSPDNNYNPRNTPPGQWDRQPGQDLRYSRQGSPEGNWNRQGQWDHQTSQDPRYSRQDNRPRSPENRPRSPVPPYSPHWDHQSYSNGPQYSSNQPEFRHSYDNTPQYSSGQSGDPQNRQFYQNQSNDGIRNASRYSSDHPGGPGPQFSPQNAPFHHNQPENPQLRSHPQNYSNPQFNPQNQSDDHSSYGNRSQYPSYQPTHSQECFETPILSQNRPIHHNPPSNQSGPPHPQYNSQHHRNQTDTDRRTVPTSLSPRVSNISSSEDNIRHSESSSSSVSGDQFQDEQPNLKPSSFSDGQSQEHQRPSSRVSNAPSAPQASFRPSSSNSHSQAHHPPPNQGFDIPTTSQFRHPATYSDGHSQNLQGYATSSDDSESDYSSSSSDTKPEDPPKSQKQGYSAFRSYFPSSPAPEGRNRRKPVSTAPVEPTTPQEPSRPKTPPFDYHNYRGWNPGHVDDFLEVMEPENQLPIHEGTPRDMYPVRQPGQGVPQSSQPDQRAYKPQEPENWDQRDPELRDPVSRLPTGSQASHHSSQPVKDHRDHEPQESVSRDHRSHRSSQASYQSAKNSWPVKDHRDPEPSRRGSTDHQGSKPSFQASHPPSRARWTSEPENPDPVEDQHQENHIYNAVIPETSSVSTDNFQDHPYLPALQENQILVVNAPNPELLIASAAISLSKTDWHLKTRGLKQRGTQVILIKSGLEDPGALKIVEALLEALEAPEASGLNFMRFTWEDTLRIDFDRCLARKLRGILRHPDRWHQRIVLQAARYLANDPVSPKIEDLLQDNSHVPGMSMDEWTSWYMERWAPDVLLSSLECLEEATRYLRKVESVQVFGAGPGGIQDKFPGAQVAMIGDVLGDGAAPRHSELVEILKESFSGIRDPEFLSLRPETHKSSEVSNHYLKLRPGVFPTPDFPLLLLHNTSTQGTKAERNLRELQILERLVTGILGMDSDQPIPPEDLQIICIEKNQVKDLRKLETPGIRIRSRQEASEGAQGVYTKRKDAPEEPWDFQDHQDPVEPHNAPQTTPIAIICCSNYKKSAFELIRDQLPQLLSYGSQATIFIGNIDEMEAAEGWSALVTRCEEVRCSYSYRMTPEEWIKKFYEPTWRDLKGYDGPQPRYGGSENGSMEFWGSGSPRSVRSGSESRGGSKSPKSEPRRTEAEPRGPEQFKREPEPSEPKAKDPEHPESSGPGPEAYEPKPEESEPPESEQESEVCEPKPEAPEPSEPIPEDPDQSEEEPDPSEPNSEESEPKFEPSKPETVSSNLSLETRRTPERDYITPDRQLEDLKFEDFEPSDPEYEDCKDSEGSEEFEDARGAENQDSDTETYESAYSDPQMITELSIIQEMCTGSEESENHKKFEEKQ